MDVRLPDGTIIQNVPDGTTQAQLAIKLADNGFDPSRIPKVTTQPAPALKDAYGNTVLSMAPPESHLDAEGNPIAPGATQAALDAYNQAESEKQNAGHIIPGNVKRQQEQEAAQQRQIDFAQEMGRTNDDLRKSILGTGNDVKPEDTGTLIGRTSTALGDIGAQHTEAATPGNVVTGLVNSAGLSMYQAWQGFLMHHYSDPEYRAFNPDADKLLEQAKSNYAAAEDLKNQEPMFDSATGQKLYKIYKGFAEFAPEMASFAAGPEVGVPVMTAAAAAQGYGKYTVRGASPTMATVGGLAEGGIMAATSALPMGALLDKFGSSGVGQFAGKMIANGVAPLTAQGIAMSIPDYAIGNPKATVGDWLKTLPDTVQESALSALVFTGGAIAAHATVVGAKRMVFGATAEQGKARQAATINDITDPNKNIDEAIQAAHNAIAVSGQSVADQLRAVRPLEVQNGTGTQAGTEPVLPGSVAGGGDLVSPVGNADVLGANGGRGGIPSAVESGVGSAGRPDESGNVPRIQEPGGAEAGVAAGNATPVADRRQNAALRKKVSDMSPEERADALLLNHLTGIKNDRAYAESEKLPYQASIDVDGLKWINDNLGHEEGGDELLKNVAHALAQQTPNAYHLHGDEFIVQGNTPKEIHNALTAAQDALKNTSISAKMAGKKITVNGLGFSYGIGHDMASAESNMLANKMERTHLGLRADRGEQPSGVTIEGTGNASEKQSTTPVGEQPGRPQGTREQRSEGVGPREQGVEPAGTVETEGAAEPGQEKAVAKTPSLEDLAEYFTNKRELLPEEQRRSALADLESRSGSTSISEMVRQAKEHISKTEQEYGGQNPAPKKTPPFTAGEAIESLPRGMRKAALKMMERAQDGRRGGLVFGSEVGNRTLAAKMLAERHFTRPEDELASLNSQLSIAYHGSPYKFDKFTLEHIGKGEGAQAFGWGLYFAGDKKVAEYYRDTLSKGYKPSDEYIYKGKTASQHYDEAMNAGKYGDALVWERVQLHESKAILRERFEQDAKEGNGQAKAALKLLEKLPDDLFAKPSGQLYEVDIPEAEQMLDWDKPLSEQPEAVKKALNISKASVKWEQDGDTWKGSNGWEIKRSGINGDKFEVYGNLGKGPAGFYGTKSSIEAAKEHVENLTGSNIGGNGKTLYDDLIDKFKGKYVISEGRVSKRGTLGGDTSSEMEYAPQHSYGAYDSVLQAKAAYMRQMDPDLVKSGADDEYAARHFDQAARNDMLAAKVTKVADPKEAASKYLHSLGIQGIKYLDQGSRAEPYEVVLSTSKGEYSRTTFKTKAQADGYAIDKEAEGFSTKVQENAKGTHNYVVFDDNAIKILKKYQGGAQPLASSGQKVNNAFYHPELGTIFVNTDNISRRDIPGVVLHEVAHAADNPKLNEEVMRRLGIGFENDMAAQAEKLEQEARAKGYASLDEYARKEPDAFAQSAEKWRSTHPMASIMMPSEGDPIERVQHGGQSYDIFKDGDTGGWFIKPPHDNESTFNLPSQSPWVTQYLAHDKDAAVSELKSRIDSGTATKAFEGPDVTPWRRAMASKQAAATGDIYSRVRARMEAAGEQHNPREATAYLVEEAMRMGQQAGHSRLDSGFWGWATKHLPESVVNTLKQWVAAVRAAMYRNGIMLKEKDLSIDDFVAVAKANMRDIAQGKLEAAGGEVAASKEGKAEAEPQEQPKKIGWLAKSADKAKELGDEIAHTFQMAITPMAAGSEKYQAIAKDYANAERKARWQWQRFDEILRKNYTFYQLRQMWEAADEQNVLMQKGESTTGKGLDRLPQDQRETMEVLHQYGEQLLQRAREAGMFQGEGLPYWTPRIAAMIGDDGEYVRPPYKGEPSSNNEGRNITSTSPNLKQRKYLTSEETEAAMKGKFGETAQIVRNIRAMPMAMERLERAIAGRELINKIKELGNQTGDELVSTNLHDGYFTLDHPAFKTYRPRFVEVDGKHVPATDQNGDMIFDRVPLYMRNDLKGPIKSVMSAPGGKVYNALMAIKGKVMSVIMYSPLIHNAVEYGRALPVLPGKVLTFRVYFDGYRAKNDPVQMRQAVDDGMVPIGHRGGFQDISGMMEAEPLAPGRSLTAKAAGGIVGLVNKHAGELTKMGIDKAGDIWHNTLLWDRVADLQMGLYVNLKRIEAAKLMKKGMDEEQANGVAGKIAAHFANRYAGALPNESMSAMSRKLVNLAFFSRSFTVGNLGVMKDIFTGLPEDVQAQIKRDYGELALRAGRDVARRKALAAFVMDVGLMYAMNSVTQDAFDMLKRDKSLSDVEKGYAERFGALLHRAETNPLAVLNSPLDSLESLSSTSANEPGKENRILYGYDKHGTAIYVRMPTGKIGEEFIGWTTSPLEMLKRKQSTFLRPMIQTFENDKGFGQRVYNPDDPGVQGAIRNVGKIAWNFMTQQIPNDSINSMLNSAKGTGTEMDAYKVLGPLMGLTFSKGASGGPAVGEMYRAEQLHQSKVMDIMPEVRDLINQGNTQGAIQKMIDAGMSSYEIKAVIEHTIAPESRLNSRAMKKFQRSATPEDQEKMSRILNR